MTYTDVFRIHRKHPVHVELISKDRTKIYVLCTIERKHAIAQLVFKCRCCVWKELAIKVLERVEH